MKLTNAMKDSIINAVMQDTPHEYSYEQALSDATLVAVSTLPKEVKALWENKATRNFVATRHYSRIQGYLPITDKNPKIDAIAERSESSHRKRNELKSHVRNVVYQFSTDTQMRQAIPELDKYIPKPMPKIKQLPVVNGLIAELTKAGFPK